MGKESNSQRTVSHGHTDYNIGRALISRTMYERSRAVLDRRAERTTRATRPRDADRSLLDRRDRTLHPERDALGGSLARAGFIDVRGRATVTSLRPWKRRA